MRSKFRNFTSLLPTLTALVVLLLVTGVCANLMRGFRVFSHGENLWSKSEKQLQIDLLWFSYNRDPLLLADAAKNLKVLEGDRMARVQLDSPNPNYQIVFEGFVRGGNAPEDIPSAIRDYRLFGHTQALSRAQRAWRDADKGIDELKVCLSKLADLGPIGSNDNEAAAIGNRLMGIDRELTDRQRVFSETMNYESNRAESILLILNAVAGAFFFMVAGIVSRRLARRLLSAELKDLALRRANDELEARVAQRKAELETEVLERRQVEKELRWKTAFLEAQGNAIVDGILVVDSDRKILFQNERWRELLKIPEHLADKGDVAMQSEHVMALAKYRDRFLKRTSHLRDHPHEIERDEMELRDGTVLDWYSAPVQGKQNEYYGRIWALRDITEHKRADKRLRESEERFRQVVEAAPIGIYIQTDGLLRYLNPAALVMFGAESSSQIVGQRFLDYIHPDSRAAVTERAHTVKLERIAVPPLEEKHLRIDGSAFDTENSAVPFTFEDRDGAIVFFRDITEQKRADRAMRDALQSAAAANRAKSEFLANMSHEIRTPLNGVIGMTELALESNTPEDQRDYIETIKSSGESLLAVINDILDFSKIEAGKMDLEAIDFNLRDCLSALLRPLGFRAEEKGIELLSEIDPDVPQMVTGDSGRLRQVILNLVSNAIKFTAIGRVSVRVKMEEGENHSAHLHFTVADSGIGIPRDKQEAIFSSFTQADASTTRKYGGTGLGLTICARLVSMMGGTIWVESEVGSGSQFHFTVQMEGVAGVVEQPMMLPVETKAAAASRLRILLAEDNRVNQVVATRMLEKMGHSVFIVADGIQALSQFSQECFDLILMDVQMPEMDGFAATRRIRESERCSFRAPIPIIAMTAHAMTGDRERCLEAGMDGYISKPITGPDLEKAIAGVFSMQPKQETHVSLLSRVSDETPSQLN